MTVAEFVLDPRLAADTVAVAELAVCSVRLMQDARWPWLILVPRVADARDLADLTRDQQHAVLDEVDAASRVLRRLDRPAKLNVAALGNVVAQLHIHVIARNPGDAAWPAPVWGLGSADAFTAPALAARVAALRAAFAALA